MKFFGLIVATYAALVFETSVADSIAVAEIRPVLLPLAVVGVVLCVDGWPAILGAAIIGLLADCLTADRLGIEMISATGCAVVIQRLRSDETKSSTWTIFGLSFLTVFAMTLFAASARSLFSGRAIDHLTMVSMAAGIAAYSTLLGMGLLFVWRLVAGSVSRETGIRSHGDSAHWNMLTE